MIFLVLSFIGVAFTYWLSRNLYYDRLETEYSYKYYKLRDKLRRLAIEGKVDKNDWGFDYLDLSLSKTVNKIGSINLFVSVFLTLKHRKDEKYIQFCRNVAKKMKENELFNEIFVEYGKLSSQYVIGRHFWLRFIFRLTLSTTIGSMKVYQKFKQFLDKSSINVRTLPETSAGYAVAYC